VVPLVGPNGPPAAPARDPFDELWNAYGRKQERSKAKAEYRRLDPNPTLHAQIVRAASDWTAAYKAQGRPGRFRKYLHTWLAGECWMEDGPEPYQSRKAATTVKRRPREIEDDYRTWLEEFLHPGDRLLARFIDWMEIECSKERTVFDFDFAALKDRRVIGRFIRRVVNPSEEFEQLWGACGKDLSVDDFPGALVWVVMGKDGRIEFERYEGSGVASNPQPSNRHQDDVASPEW
jgi:hypothetical protein